MTEHTDNEKPQESPLPKNLVELAGFSIREFGLAAVLGFFCYVQWVADQQRSERTEKILISNGDVLRSNAVFMERMGQQLEIHEATARRFIQDAERDLNEIKVNTSAK